MDFKIAYAFVFNENIGYFSISGNILQQSEKLFIHTIILIMLGNRIIYYTVLFYFEIQFFEAKSY